MAKKEAFDVGCKAEWVHFNGFSVLEGDKKDIVYAKDACCCDTKDYVLTLGIGLQEWKPEGVQYPFNPGSDKVRSVFALRKKAGDAYNTIPGYLTSKGSMFLYSAEQHRFTECCTWSEDAIILPFFIHSSVETSRKAIALWDNKLWMIEPNLLTSVEMPNPICATEFYNRLFVYKAPFELRYSALNRPLRFINSIDESGSLYLDRGCGEVVALQPVGERLYIVREYGIQWLEARGAARNFKLHTGVYCGGRIFGGSVGAFGDKLVFLADDGVYFYDGTKAERKMTGLKIQPSKVNQRCRRGPAGNKYLISYQDAYAGERTIVMYADGINGYFAPAFQGLSELENRAACYHDNSICTVEEEGELPGDILYRFTSKNIDFGGEDRKLLKRLRFTGEGNSVLYVGVDGADMQAYRLLFQDGIAEIEIMERGQKFCFEFILSNAVKVRSMSAEIERL